MKKVAWFILISLLMVQIGPQRSLAQEKSYRAATIAFYNLENLFDTIDNPSTEDQEFTPRGSGLWDSKKYHTKLDHLSQVIRKIGNGSSQDSPVIVGLAEVENRDVVQDLIMTPVLRPMKYGIVHYNSPDRRGIDVAMIYRTSHFKVLTSNALPLYLPGDTSFHSRDVLLVKGILDGDTLYVLVNHWPSRRGGETETEPLRAAAALVCRKAVDSINTISPDAKLLIMGDLNDDPVDESLTKYLRARLKKDQLKDNDLYNPMGELYRIGQGSLAYRDAWNLFDQIILSRTLMDHKTNGYFFYKAGIYNPKYLIQKDGPYAGYPFRTYGSGVYLGGYSDHLPVFVVLVKEKK